MKKPIAATGFLLLSFLFPLKATAASFTQMYVFGDSVSDTGNVFDFTGGAIPPSPPYFDGRFSNGPLWVDYLAQDLGLSLTPYSDVAFGGVIPTGGIDFAFAGATTGLDNTVYLTNPNLLPPLPGLQQQIGLFTSLVSPNQAADPNALYIVLAGFNDYLPTTSTFIPFETTDTTIANLSSVITSLAALGAQNIMVPNLPPLGELPITLSTPDSDRLNTLTDEHNSDLNVALDTLSQSFPSLNIIPVDLNSLFEDAISEPATFGFTNVTTPCLFVGCPNPEEYLFWDLYHPTTATHEFIADVAFQSLNSDSPTSVPEPTSGLGILAFGALGAGSVLKRQYRKASSTKGKSLSSLLS
jgi:phospholipase/lecithinase/hemolysin